MKNFSLLAFIFALFFMGCDTKIDLSSKDVKWDREICERCKMIMSDRLYAAQVVNPKDGKRYYYDDIGCTILWFDEEKIPWEDQAIIYVTDAKTGEWIDAKKAFWVFGKVTPMDFGFAAYKEQQSGIENHGYAYVRDYILGKPL